MPLIDRIKTVFARKGENEKKIAFLAERRTALSQQRDRSYEEMSAMEGREAGLRQQFKDASGDLTKRRVTSQLLQLRKDIERRQQLLTVLNQQINVVSTHLHNLELVQQGQSAQLPEGEEIAADAAKAEEMLAQLEADSELVASVGGIASVGLSAEEQALYEELELENSKPVAASESETANVKPVAKGEVKTPAPQRRAEPEAG
jgi:capsule polysaccharide export protein KpsE/RkpR